MTATISVPVPPTVCDCGHPPTVLPAGSIGTGYGRALDGKTFCYECGAERMRQHFRDAKYGDEPIVAYVNDYMLSQPGVHPNDSRDIEIIDWPGSVMGKGYITRASFGVGGRRHYVVVKIEGRVWHGKYYPQAHELVRLRLYKDQ